MIDIKVGDKVKVIANYSLHGLPIGAIREVKQVITQGQIGLDAFPAKRLWWVGSKEVELVEGAKELKHE